LPPAFGDEHDPQLVGRVVSGANGRHGVAIVGLSANSAAVGDRLFCVVDTERLREPSQAVVGVVSEPCASICLAIYF